MDPAQVTQILRRLSEGDGSASEELAPLVYAELHSLARRHLGRQASSHTLQPTALVNEAWLKLVGDRHPAWGDRGHFFGVAARAMRQILVDHARRAGARKRGGDYKRVDLDELVESFELAQSGLLDLDEALERLTQVDAELAQLVELRFFAGLSVSETAEALGISLRKAERSWVLARSWLHRELTRAPSDAD